METTINQRLKTVINDKKIYAPELYSKIGVSRSVWSGWVNAGRAIPLEKLVKLIRLIPSINARWLLTGDGEMHEVEIMTVNEPAVPYKITRIDCPECILKQNEIAALKIALQAKEELLDMYRTKKEQNCG